MNLKACVHPSSIRSRWQQHMDQRTSSQNGLFLLRRLSEADANSGRVLPVIAKDLGNVNYMITGIALIFKRKTKASELRFESFSCGWLLTITPALRTPGQVVLQMYIQALERWACDCVYMLQRLTKWWAGLHSGMKWSLFSYPYYYQRNTQSRNFVMSTENKILNVLLSKFLRTQIPENTHLKKNPQ